MAKGETASFQWVFRSVYPVKNLKIEAGKAAQLATSIIRNYDRYDNSITSFRAKRVQLLEWLSHTDRVKF